MSSLANEDLSLTRVVELEDMEVVEEREEMVEPRVSFHSEEERHMSRKLPFEDPAKFHEDVSTPSRMVRYHSENERDSSRGGSSSESGEDDVIIAEYTGTGEAIEQVGGLGQNPFNHNPYSLNATL